MIYKAEIKIKLFVLLARAETYTNTLCAITLPER
jgi:hypothetical protein